MEIFTNFKALVFVIFFFGASIFVHELGHFLAARWRGLKVTRFSIGFGPRLFSWKRRGVEYIVAALPIGGYVALPQLGHMEMIEGKSEPVEQPQPITWTSKVIVLVAGAFFNVLFALLLGTILYFMGGYPDRKSNFTTIVGNVSETMQFSEEEVFPNPAFVAGLERGDIIRAIDGEPIQRWDEVRMKVIMGAKRTEDGKPLSLFTIERNGTLMELDVLPIVGGDEKIRDIWLSPAMIPIVGAIFENSPAEKADLQIGDQFVSANGIPLISLHQVSELVQANGEQAIEFNIKRGNEVLTKTITPAKVTNEAGSTSLMIGLGWAAETTYVKESPFLQIATVVDMTFDTLQKLIHPSSDIGLRHLSGPIGMGRLIYQSALADIRYVLWIVVIININLAILNLLPIPVLDGGHILFSTIEKIRGRALPANVLISLQSAFVIALLSLMLYVTAFDGLRIFRDNKQEKTDDSAQFVPVFQDSEEKEDANTK